MKIINLTKGIILAEEAVIAETFFARIRGLLGKKEFMAGQALVIKPCNSIHTFFMRFPIDVLFSDKNNRIIAATPALAAFRISRVYFNAAYVVELPAGVLKTTSTSVGDLLEIKR
jgi:uncharacterized protein